VWFLREAHPDHAAPRECLSARRSVTQSTGESDLELIDLCENGNRLIVMIENKVGAGFQPMQAERYRMRADGYLSRGDCDSVTMVITAPQAYFGTSDSSKGFDGRVTYEAILGWFRESPGMGRRLWYKEAVLQSAIDKAALGYQPVEDAVATKFWRDYWEFVRTHAPELRMPEPGVKTSGATFIELRPDGLPSQGVIMHKLTGTKGSRNGYMDLQLGGMGELVHEIEEALRALLEPDMLVVRTGGSAAIRLDVEMIDPNQDSEGQIDGIIASLDAATRLHRWFQSDPDIRSAVESLLS
jgi:hypothetical protein